MKKFFNPLCVGTLFLFSLFILSSSSAYATPNAISIDKTILCGETEIAAISLGNKQIPMTWDIGTNSTFSGYVKSIGGTTSTFNFSGSVYATNPSFPAGSPTGNTYYIRVYYYDAKTNSYQWSNVVSCTIFTQPFTVTGDIVWKDHPGVTFIDGLCGNSTVGVLRLQGIYSGKIDHWEYTVGNGNKWTAIPNTADLFEYTTFPLNAASDYAFRVILSSGGGCSSVSVGYFRISTAVGPNLTITNPMTVCAPATVDISTAYKDAVTGYDSDFLNVTFYNSSMQQIGQLYKFVSYNLYITNLSAVQHISTPGTYYIKKQYHNGCSDIKPVTVNIQSPVSFVTQAQNANVCENTNAAFSVSTSGTVDNFDWQYKAPGGSFKSINNGQKPGITSTSTSSTLSLSAPASLNGYSYRCVTTNSCGTATSNSAILTILANPAISSQSISHPVCEGASVNVSVSASGAALAYEWQVDKGTGFINMDAADPLYTNSNSPMLKVVTATLDMNSYKYRCMISGQCGTPVNSTPVSLDVTDTPDAPATASVVSICSGSPAVLSVTPVNNTSVNWYNNLNQLLATGNSYTSGIFTNTTALPVSYAYQAEAVNAGTSTCTSPRAHITVNVNPSLTNLAVSSSNGNTLCKNKTTSLTASGADTYAWNTGETTATILAFNTDPALAQTVYTVTGTNTYGCSATAQKTISWLDYPASGITNASGATDFCEGSSVTLHNTSTLQTQWYNNGIPVAGATSPDYVATQNGYYSAQVFDGNCTNTANGIAITVHPKAFISSSSVSQPQYFCIGKPQSYSISIGGEFNSSQWEIKKVGDVGFSPVAAGSNFSIQANATSSTITIFSDMTIKDALVRCLISGNCGNIYSEEYSIQIDPSTSIVTNPVDQTTCAGKTATFVVQATGAGAIFYNWQVDMNNGSGFVSIASANSPFYTVNATAAMNGYRYRCLVGSDCGSSVLSSEAILFTNGLPAAPAVNVNVACGHWTALANNNSTDQVAYYRWYYFNNIVLQDHAGNSYNYIYCGDVIPEYPVYVSAVTSTGCEGAKTAFTESTLPCAPAKPTAGSVTRCGQGSVTLTAVGGSSGKFGGNYRWYDANQVEISGVTGASYTTPVLSATADFYVSIMGTTCESDRVKVQAIIQDPLSGCVPTPRLGVQTAGEINIDVYPNPFTNKLVINLDASANQEHVSVIITAMDGRQVYSGTLEQNSTTLSLPNGLPEGIYIVSISGDSYHKTVKLVKQ